MDEVCKNIVLCLEEGSESTGWFKRRVSYNRWIKGAWAGTLEKSGYRSIKVNGKKYMEHRLVYWIYYRDMPPLLDHIDGNRANNRITNLRVATPRQNNCNRNKLPTNKSGYIGVFLYRDGKFKASIRVNRKRIHLGTFETAELAAREYDNAARHYNGMYAVLNFPDIKSV